MFKFQSLASALYFLAASVSATRNGGSKADEPRPHDRVGREYARATFTKVLLA
jgi:hypothetical protein